MGIRSTYAEDGQRTASHRGAAPALVGTMTMTWTVTPAPAGSLVEIRADDVPDGIRAR